MTSRPRAHNELPIATILSQLRNMAAQPFETAHPIPAALNHSTAFLEHERQHVFMSEWICVGRTDEIPQEGDYLTHEIAEVPVFVIRQSDGSIRAFVNACAHRFACLLPDKKGSAKRITCRYHAWSYAPDGQLIRAPFMDMKDGFDVTQHRLRELHAETWEGFIYVNASEAPTHSVAETLAPLRDGVVGRFDMAGYRTIFRETMVWNANWKNLIGNFIESYHVPFVHGQTFAQHKKPLSDYICGEDNDHYCYHRAAKTDASEGGWAHPDNTRLEGEWRGMMVDFCVFPSHLVTLMPDYLWYISVQPDGLDRMRALWGVAVPAEILDDIDPDRYETWLSDFMSYMNIANDEDKTLVEALHTGTASPILPEGTFHPIERNLWQFNRYLARLCCKV